MQSFRSHKLVSLFVLVAFVFAAALPSVTRAAPDKPAQTIVEIAASNPDFSTLVAAVQKAGLVDALNGTKRYTVFAPTNDAFDALADQLGYADGMALVNALTAEELQPILLYHVANGNRSAKTLFPPQKVWMVSKGFAMTSVSGSDKFIDGQPILATNIRASNGFIHVIGGVMLP